MALRIVLIGQAAFAEQVVRGLLVRGDEVVAVYCPPDRGGRPDSLKQLAVASDISCRQPANYKSATVRAEIAALAADLLILAYVTQIVPVTVLELPRLGSICFHPSLLPRYRGGSAINWALINGETETGITVFWPDAGIDTGPLLLQRPIPVGPDDSAGSLYYQRILPAGVALVLESVASIEAGRAPRIPQDESRATYDPLCRDAHAAIDWTRPASALHNLVRGCDPQPAAYTTVPGREWLRLYESRCAEGSAPPGTILAFDAGALVVAAGKGALRLGKARVDGTRDKKPAAEVAAALGLVPGDRLGG
jgi:methionyl-tRNA formyltransferase